MGGCDRFEMIRREKGPQFRLEGGGSRIINDIRLEETLQQ